ncbi:acid phosphatase (class A) [Rhodobium orientis]|uniref:acid phosphatase n=1 Tax=Rhodobium orientis TaxID=34017 RepID=UPI0017B8EF76|nr:phosphatase PAP2 family protein [Rhodobium orientis]MBB4302063.1 acid phosphatase (class A) [Rhodobium orientis]
MTGLPAPGPRMRQAAGAIGLLLAASVAGAHPAAAEDAAQKKMVTVSGQQVEEIMSGILAGYLSEDERLDSKRFVPPAPAEGSARQKLDAAWSASMLKLKDSPRWEIATRDAAYFPGAADTFSCALGIRISEETTPALYLLLWRSLTDIGLATYTAKNAYARERPFMANDKPVCTPEIQEGMRKDGSYPSGHTAYGWGWALILTELAPDRAEEILARGRAYGESRSVCNVH